MAKINRSLGGLIFIEGMFLGALLHWMAPKFFIVTVSWLSSYWLYYWYNERKMEQQSLVDKVERKLGGGE